MTISIKVMETLLHYGLSPAEAFQVLNINVRRMKGMRDRWETDVSWFKQTLLAALLFHVKVEAVLWLLRHKPEHPALPRLESNVKQYREESDRLAKAREAQRIKEFYNTKLGVPYEQ